MGVFSGFQNDPSCLFADPVTRFNYPKIWPALLLDTGSIQKCDSRTALLPWVLVFILESSGVVFQFYCHVEDHHTQSEVIRSTELSHSISYVAEA